jgi:hypothetical protein
MRDFVYIGSTPCDEPCEQVGSSYNGEKARKECRAFINQLLRMFGPEPEGAELKIKLERHDFGSYPEVVCYFDDEKQESVDYAFKCEGESPANWDLQAVIELQPSESITAGYKLTIGAILDSK